MSVALTIGRKKPRQIVAVCIVALGIVTSALLLVVGTQYSRAIDGGAVADWLPDFFKHRKSVASAVPVGQQTLEGYANAKATTVPIGAGVGGASLRWRSILAASNTEWAISQLAISESPDDWYRAATLATICAATASIPAVALEDALKMENSSAQHSAEVLAIHQNARLRCSAVEGQSNPLSLMAGILTRARDAGSALANAPRLGAKVLQSGLQAADAERLKAVIRDGDKRSAWINSNINELVSAIAKTPIAIGMSNSEIVGAVFQSLCQSGDDCGPESIYNAAICAASAYELCSTKGVQIALTSTFAVQKVTRVTELSAEMLAAFETADLSALGIPLVTGR